MYAVKADEIIENIDFMPVDLKTTLIEKLLISLHRPTDEIDATWIQECNQRLDSCENLKDGNEVFANIKSRFQN
jgi:hypothetical protein